MSDVKDNSTQAVPPVVLDDTATQAIDPALLEEKKRQEEARRSGQVSIDELGALMGDDDDLESVDQTRQFDPEKIG